MTTLTIEKPTEKPTVTVDIARKNAKQLALVAWAAQPTRQPDGAMLDLCYTGRMHRAYKMLGDARTANDAARVKALTDAIDKLRAITHEAWNAAEGAISEYNAVCAVAGITPDDLYPPECNCIGCQEGGKHHRLGSALGNVRAAVWSFLCDDADGETQIIALMRKAKSDERARDALWRHIVKIADAEQVYIAECAKYGERPYWKGLLA